MALTLSSVAAQKHPTLQRLSFCERLGLKKREDFMDSHGHNQYSRCYYRHRVKAIGHPPKQ